MFIQLKSIKAKYLASGLLISLVSLLVVSAASYYVSHSIVSRQLDMRMQAIAERNASDLSLWFNNHKQLIECTASDMTVTESFDPQTMHKIFAEKVGLSHKNIKAFYMGDANVNKIYIVPEWNPPSTFHVQSRPWFKEAVAAGEGVIITKPFEDAVVNSDQTTDFIVTIAKALYRDKKLVGVLAADISLKDVTDTVRNFSFGQKSYAFLLDTDGNIISHPNKNFLASKSGLKNIGSVTGVEYSELIKAVTTKNSDIASQSLRVKDYDGMNRNVVLSKIASSGWLLGIATDATEYSKPLSTLLYGFAAAMLVSLLVGIGIMLQLVRGMTHPISLLHTAVKSFSASDMNARVDLRSEDEIGDLATSFNQMADTIQENRLSLEQKVAERTQELQEKNDNIMESIDYAERLQRAILPPLPHRLGISADKCFVIWKPKDVVGGDMYWCRGDERFVLVAVVDCTGHGVPGALMTMTMGSILDGLPRELEGVKPSDLLYKIHNRLKETLCQEHKDSLANDGADMALCLIDKMDRKFMFAGAKLSLFLEKDGKITEYKGVKHSVGYSLRKDVIYEDRLIEWADGSVVYLTTDGLLDQHSEEGKWGIGRSGFVSMLEEIAGKTFAEKEKFVELHIAERVKRVEQRDDITVVGFEIGENLKGRIGI